MIPKGDIEDGLRELDQGCQGHGAPSFKGNFCRNLGGKSPRRQSLKSLVALYRGLSIVALAEVQRIMQWKQKEGGALANAAF